VVSKVRLRLVILFGVIVALLVVLGLVIWQRFDGLTDNPDANSARVVQTGAKLAAAKTAKIAFTGQLQGSASAQLVGTTSIVFSADPTFAKDAAWTTAYTPPKYGPPSLTATVLHQGDTTLIRSPKLAVAAKTPWVDMDRTSLIWPSPTLDPTLGFTDFTLWQQKIQNLTAEKSKFLDEDLPDVTGAPYKYKIECWQADSCPLPFGTNLDHMVTDSVTQTTFSLWYGEDGLLRRLDVTGALEYVNNGAGDATSDLYPHLTSEDYQLSFTLGDFGAPVTVTEPPATEIASARFGIRYTN
jgi:hypothetical protein